MIGWNINIVWEEEFLGQLFIFLKVGISGISFWQFWAGPKETWAEHGQTAFCSRRCCAVIFVFLYLYLYLYLRLYLHLYLGRQQATQCSVAKITFWIEVFILAAASVFFMTIIISLFIMIIIVTSTVAITISMFIMITIIAGSGWRDQQVSPDSECEQFGFPLHLLSQSLHSTTPTRLSTGTTRRRLSLNHTT